MISWATCRTCGFRWFAVPMGGCPVCTYKEPPQTSHSESNISDALKERE